MNLDMFFETFVACLWARIALEALRRNDLFNSIHKPHLWNI